MNVGVFEDYGPLKVGNSYCVVLEGFDNFLLKCKGSNVHVPRNLINFKPEKVTKKKELDYEDEFTEEYMDYLVDYMEELRMDGV